jgi:hypothetical protein
MAMQNPELSREQAAAIAHLPGNLGVIKKLHEFKILATEQDFADALFAVAHGQTVTKRTQKAILLDMVKPKAPLLLNLPHEIESSPQTFQQSIQQRIAQFSPPDADIRLDGYVVAAGDGGGYAFGGTDFFLNIGIIGDFALAKSTTEHELYHAVQGAYAKEREWKSSGGKETAQQACTNVAQLFANLYEEGSATYVEDPSLLTQSHSAAAARISADMEEGLKHAPASATLLEMSVASLTANEPVPFDNVYEVDLLGHGVLYDIAYVMAKAIVEQDGPQGLAALLKQPPYRFVSHYTQLAAYGVDENHPPLGPNTLATVKELAGGCSSRSGSASR